MPTHAGCRRSRSAELTGDRVHGGRGWGLMVAEDSHMYLHEPLLWLSATPSDLPKEMKHGRAAGLSLQGRGDTG